MGVLNFQRIEAKTRCPTVLQELESIHQSLPSNNSLKGNVNRTLKTTKKICDMELHEGSRNNWQPLLDTPRYLDELKTYLRQTKGHTGGKRTRRHGNGRRARKAQKTRKH